ncbi:thiol-disulfide oxidoreductase DCC family protein [Paenibacillus nasutitermitis]|uniref:DUF393 domain-containing protein n=1 Tax=Paenibacillus nasutitermitis TaxID=1652958 RepID=A0A916YP78_9BACL|nr:DUF393 domain-containing protein [Paenibacillus nasutitermitis]GGD54759.1 hypothetical protein GCM10010911_10510 [Paenibacillus nasutitermitis]
MGKRVKEDVGERLTVLYDDICNLCLTTVRRLKELRSTADLRFVSIQSLEENEEEIPGIQGYSREQLLAKLHVVDQSGAVYAGADGVIRILRTVRGLKWLAFFYRIPGMRGLADILYRYIAARRYDWFGKADDGCANGACTLPRRE